jgi:hypothetical protein
MYRTDNASERVQAGSPLYLSCPALLLRRGCSLERRASVYRRIVLLSENLDLH